MDIVGARYLDSDRTGTSKMFFPWIIIFSTEKIFFSCQFGLDPDISHSQNRVLCEAPDGDKRNYMTLKGEVTVILALQFC